MPVSLWDTYSAFANSYGGVIILGVKEQEDKTWKTTGLKNADKLQKDFWDTINNSTKVSINLLNEKDVEIHEIGEDVVMVIHCPKAPRELKPVYINGDMFKGSFKRNHEGDYHCTPLQVKSMLRDQTETTMDMHVLENFVTSDLCQETVHAFRNNHRVWKPTHPWNNISDDEYLEKIGAAGKGDDGKLHPTAAGLLMFGEEYKIVREFPEYFLDYQEILDPVTRWTDRLQSSSGEWTGNLFDFYFRVYNKITRNVKVPFKLVGGERIDDTPVHKALREALANCLANADFFIPRGIVIKQGFDELSIDNPGSVRVGVYQMKKGGKSDPRNKAIMKMFNLLGIGERAGSGIPEIFEVWRNEGWKEPEIEEYFDYVERTRLMLYFKGIDDLGKNTQVSTQVNTQVDDEFERILSFCKTEKTKQEIADFIGYKSLKQVTKIFIKPLIDDGRLSMTIPDKPTSSKQKYVKT